MKAALITGGARRIGAAIALELAASGWHVILHYRSSGDEAAALKRRVEEGGGRVSLLAADLAQADAPGRLVEAAFAASSGLELVVNNASSFVYDTAQSASMGSLAASFAVNAAAPIVIGQEFAAGLAAGREGVIVNILDNRVLAPNPDYFSYGVSKLALAGATRMLALALAPRVRVNGIAPGITLRSGEQSEDNFARTHPMNPLGRGAAPEDIARAVGFLYATRSMTGAIITIDGGQFLANAGRDVAFIGSDQQ